MWIARPTYICQDQATASYLQMHLNTENSLFLRGRDVFVEFLSWNKYCKAAQKRSFPREIDTNSSRTGAAVTSAILLGLEGDSIQGARKWHCNSQICCTHSPGIGGKQRKEVTYPMQHCCVQMLGHLPRFFSHWNRR